MLWNQNRLIMGYTRAFLGFILVVPVLAWFEKDVLRGAHRQKVLTAERQQKINDALLSKAVPLKEYEQMLEKKGVQVSRSLEGENDDFAVDYDYMYSFSGYSLKYARCQPVQYFSENAVLAGEHSPMVTQDIVILRLCPESSCSSSASYGCYYNYAEYALTVSDYVNVMLRYTAKKRDLMCEWCQQCIEGNEEYANEAANDDAANNQERRLEDAEAEEDEEAQDEEAEEEQEEEQAEEEAGDDVAQYACDGYADYCYDYYNLCDEGGDDDNYIDYEGYLDYLDCSQVEYNDYAYFVRPRCDGSSGAIKMAVYYDDYCIQYAGNDVNVGNLGLGMKEGVFADYYGSDCVECSENSDPPDFGTSSTLCNVLHQTSAKCTNDLMYDLFENEEDESTECSYIESLRFGAYDEEGQFASTSSSSSWNAEVTIAQKALLGLSIGLCGWFIIYACYLHHSMTNLLLKSLSHRELLPPSRTSGRRARGGSSKSRASSRKSKQVENDPDWLPPKEEAA